MKKLSPLAKSVLAAFDVAETLLVIYNDEAGVDSDHTLELYTILENLRLKLEEILR